MAILFAVLIFLIVALAIFLGGAWIEGRNAQARILRERLGGSQEQSATDNLELLRDEMISNEIPEPVAGEFRKLFEEQKFGMPVRDALMNLADRMPLVDVKFFVTAVMLQRETGGNLAEILDNLSYMIRERFKILRQVKVHTAQGRLTMMLLMGLPPIIVVSMQVLNPSFIHPLFADPIGHGLLVAGITLQTIGYFVIRKVIQIQV